MRRSTSRLGLSVSCSVRVLLIQIVVDFNDIIQRDLENAGPERRVQARFRLHVWSADPVVPAPGCVGGPAKCLNATFIIKAGNFSGGPNSPPLTLLAGLALLRSFSLAHTFPL